MFSLGGLPQTLKVSYVIWLVTAGLWLMSTLFGLGFSILKLAARAAYYGTGWYGESMRISGIRGIIVSVIALGVIAAILVCAVKLKEGAGWARPALTALAVAGIILTFFGAFVSLLGIAAAILMWLPETTAWLNARKDTGRNHS